MTPEEKADCESVWARVSAEHPEFTRAHDITGNYHAVREIVLGGSLAWLGAHKRFQPRPGMRVMDVGANAGIFSAYCAVNGADVIAYEPDSKIFRIFSKMVSDSGLHQKILSVPIAIWTSGGNVPFVGHSSDIGGCIQYNGAIPNSSLPWPSEKFTAGSPTICVSFDEAVGNYQWDCVKVDIEGAEFDVLLSVSKEALNRIKFMFVELHPWASDSLYEKLMERMEECFSVEGVAPSSSGRWQALYLSRRIA